MFRLPRALDQVEQRVLGSLLEKEVATPEAYPLTLSALVAACNQKTSRDPVMMLSSEEVEAALGRLFEDVLVWREEGARATRWRHSLDRRWGLAPSTKAVLTVLLLRGPQTVGELRARSDRLHPFGDLAEVANALAELSSGNEPLIDELPRSPGQKEQRWAHRIGEPTQHSGPLADARAPALNVRPVVGPEAPESSFDERLRTLEERVARLEGLVGAPLDGAED